ncbi:hypothetical protein M9H77_07559 [Catharanthus roseus]|uniref:Uncharacterized protein n=1 Tax=Catharanthus roseus TaxID=4058 RepID=A0ACC0BV98_CATRO|nr:hypothetical protein M9H77_07559 [Catharanthus roseus]
MVKTKNANVGRGENVEEGGSSRGRGKGKRVPSGVRAPDRFISIKEIGNLEEWKRKRRKVAPSYKVDLNDMEGMEIIPNLFNNIVWVSLFIVHELYYPELIYEFYTNLHKGRAEKVGNITHQWVLSRIGGRDIAFDDRLLNNILETPEDGIRFYTKDKKCFYPNQYSIFEEIFTKGQVLKRHDDRNVNKLDAYGRLLHHMISNIIIPSVGHNSSITNMHMLALQEHKRMNFSFMATEHMLATQFSSTKCLSYGCFLTKIFQLIYNQHTFKRTGFERNEEGLFVRCRQNESDKDDDDDDDEEQEEMNVDEEESDTEPEGRNMCKKSGGENVVKRKICGYMLLLYMIMNKRSIFGVSRLHYIEEKDLGDQGIMKKKRSSHSKIKA